MGNNKPLSCKTLDEYVQKSIDLKCPLQTLPLLKNHRALMYYPKPEIISKIFKLFDELKDYESMKLFFSNLTRR